MSDFSIKEFNETKYHVSKNWVETPFSLGENDLIQVGITFFGKSTHILPHKHGNFYELTVIKDGEGTIVINHIPIRVKKNDICLTMPYDNHEIISSQGKLLQISNIAFSVSNDALVRDYNNIYRNYYHSNDRIFSNNVIGYLISLMLNEIQGDDFNSELLSSLLNSIIIYVVKSFNKKDAKHTSENITDHEVLCYQIMNYIDTNIFTIKNLNELSEITNYTYPYISSVFKKTTKTSLKDYFMNLRFEKACELLSEGNLSIVKISEILNYSSSNAFTKAYKNKFGVPPTTKKAKKL